MSNKCPIRIDFEILNFGAQNKMGFTLCTHLSFKSWVVKYRKKKVSSFKLIRHQIYVHVSRAQRKQWHQSLLDFFPPLSYISPIILKFTHNPISFQYYQSSLGKQWPTILHEILVRMREVKRRVCLIFRSGAEKNSMIFKMFLFWCTTN